MANPQVENGYLGIANELAEALAQINLSPQESRVLWAVLRQTYGWNKKSAVISLDRFALATGIGKPHICNTLARLKSRQIITQTGNGNAPEYGLQKDFDKWKSLPKQVTPITQTGNGNAPESDNQADGGSEESLPKQVTPKESLPEQVRIITQTGNADYPNRQKTTSNKATYIKPSKYSATLPENGEGEPVKPKTNSGAGALTAYFFDQHLATKGTRSSGNGAIIGVAMKKLLEVLAKDLGPDKAEPEMRRLIDLFFASDDPFLAEKTGFTIAMFQKKFDVLRLNKPARRHSREPSDFSDVEEGFSDPKVQAAFLKDLENPEEEDIFK